MKNSSDLSVTIQKHLPRSGLIAVVIMIAEIYHFLFTSSKMNIIDMYAVLIAMLVSGLILITIPIMEFVHQKPGKHHFDKLTYLCAGLVGVVEAVVSLIALTTENYTLYNLFNFTGFLFLVGLTAIFATLWFTREFD